MFRSLAAYAVGISAALATSAQADDTRPLSRFCVQEETLDALAALVLLERETPSEARLEDLAREARVDLVRYDIREFSLSDPSENWIQWIRRQGAADEIHCGLAIGSDSRVIVTGRRRASLRIEGRRLRGNVDEDAEHTWLAFFDGERVPLTMEITPEQLRAGIEAPADLHRPYVAQLVANSPNGPLPIARVYSDASRAPAFPEVSNDDAPGALQALRRAHASPALRVNRLLARAAREHALGLCESNSPAGHVSRGRGPEARVAESRIRARHLGEVVARASTPRDALESLVRSPSHLLVMLDRRFTDVGIAFIPGTNGRKGCFVAEFAAWPRFQATALVAE